MPESLSAKKWHVIFGSTCTLSAFLLLFFFRHADDNRLTSWKWVFADIGIIWFIPLILLGIIITYFLLNSPVTRQQPALFLFLSSFAICALFWKVPEVIVDASRYFTQAKHLELYGIRYFISQWGSNINAWTDLPLVPFMYGLIFKLFGESRAFIQVFTSFLFSMTVVLTYFVGRTLWDEDTGLIAGSLLWGIPYIFSQTPLMLVDIPTMFFLTLSIYSCIQAMRNGGVWIAASAVSFFCAFYSKYSAWMMLTVLGVVFLVCLKQKSGVESQESGGWSGPGIRNCINRGIFTVLIAAVLVGIALYFKYDVISDQIAFLREYQAPGLRRWGESFISTFLFQVHPFITVAAVYAIYAAFKNKDIRFLIVFWLLLLIVVFQIRRSRYVMIIFPMLTLMAAYGLQHIGNLKLRKYIVSCMIGSSLVVAAFAYLPFLQTMSMVNFRDAGRFLNSAGEEIIYVYAVPSEESAVNPATGIPVLDLFTEKKIIYYHDEEFSLPFEEIETSPLRFTWEYENPEYYKADQKDSFDYRTVVVISNRGEEQLPQRIISKLKGYEVRRTFEETTHRFRYSPVVTVYQAPQ
jgi:hypothetical protein